MIAQVILMQQKNWIKFIVVINLLTFSLLTGCTTAGNAIPQGGPTMAQVYEEAMQKSNGETLDQARGQISSLITYNGTSELSSYTRTSQNEINNLFPMSPNPQLVMYVYPHLNVDIPIPGYCTTFALYHYK